MGKEVKLFVESWRLREEKMSQWALSWEKQARSKFQNAADFGFPLPTFITDNTKVSMPTNMETLTVKVGVAANRQAPQTGLVTRLKMDAFHAL